MDERDAIIEEALTDDELYALGRALNSVQCSSNPNDYARAAFRAGQAVERRRVTREIEALPGVGRGDHGESLAGGELPPRHLVLGVVGRVSEQEAAT